MSVLPIGARSPLEHDAHDVPLDTSQDSSPAENAEARLRQELIQVATLKSAHGREPLTAHSRAMTCQRQQAEGFGEPGLQSFSGMIEWLQFNALPLRV